MKITLIAAVAKNGVIGKENDLPWYLPEDLRHFKALTTGKTVLMGRKTLESILRRNGKPLPNRKSVVVTRDQNFQAPEDVVVFHSLEEALKNLKDEDVFIIGGGEVFRQTITLADALEITRVDREIAGDVFFPKIDEAKWRKIKEVTHQGFSFATYERVKH